jgi:hypothetical protein
MKTKFALAAIILFTIIACGKDKFLTVPQLSFKSRNTDVVPVNGSLRVVLEYTDKEGDVSDSIFIVRQRLNVRGPVQLAASPYNIPDFPKTQKGEFEITLEYQFSLVFGLSPLRVPGSNPVRNEVDTLRLKIVAKDKEGNKSDTLVINDVYVTR